MAPYGPGVVAQLVPPPAPKGKAPAPVGASDHQWMASSESICSSIQEVFHCESDEAGCEHWKRLLRSISTQISAISRWCGKPAVIYGAGGMPTVRQQGDLDYG